MYSRRRMMEVPRERSWILRSVSLPVPECLSPSMAAYKVAGMIREADATAMRDDMVDATVELNSRSCAFHPPARKQHPRTYVCQRRSSQTRHLLFLAYQKHVGQNAT